MDLGEIFVFFSEIRLGSAEIRHKNGRQ